MNGDVGFFRKLPSALPGLALIVLTMVVIRNWIEPWMTTAVIFGTKGWLVKVTHLNYILLGIIMGMLYRNVVFGGKMPDVLSDGFKLSRLMIKTGIILLGSLYTFNAIVQLGSMAIFLIGGFVILTIIMVLWFGTLLGLDRSMIGVMANALSICGVTAAVATSPGVEAKASHVAYAIATILGFGILTMFISPFIGHALELTDLQYGAWIGTGILNSGQVLAAALAFNPNVAPGTAVSVAEIWNIMRVISIPFAVFAVTVWYWAGKTESGEGGKRKGLGTLLVEKFPVFVLGFLGMVFLTSMGAFGDVGLKGGPAASETIKMMRLWMTWIFGFGLVGLGGYIDFKELRQAGGAPLKLGLIVGVTKYVLALVVVFLIKDYLVAI
ncbi:MAG: putative sulfate exporter family transporter [Hydrogenophilales bacterium CG_4_9_14_3_um_filter_59_35]|nr:MAG: putative sulfate exporter family transporter [Hydrogenophilales bacterium CG18_big_fil_WC_8_21_14_2_50_58_12]PIY02012.1 MAG: putative sulfate exporter family transporter [Hydrogenophilales bacterium CG_4_10_14_3_um_filter_58_23]PJB06643.1 MAG: putative sulfate exporter family transporter [Hydrogenophilales bacterium CG_4_9_14_3_um_filter_59_35]